MDTTESERLQANKTAFDYAWGYFNLHSGQRMQSTNFFLIAAAFLAGTYANAMVWGRPGLAFYLSLIGAVASYMFYRMERRVRRLIHAAEAALRPVESSLSQLTQNPEIEILTASREWCHQSRARTSR
jgi:Flp pilus assembly protein TadB